jgi:hypothetical protein
VLKVIEAASQFQPDGSRGVVIIESDQTGPPFNAAFDELGGAEAVELAQRFAQTKGVAPAFLNGNKLGPYAVNADGRPLEEVKDENGKSLPQTHPKMQPHRYRLDVPVARPLR